MEIGADKKKIVIVMMIRFVAMAALIGLILLTTSQSEVNWIGLVVIGVLFLAFAISPLRHINEVLVLCPTKIAFGKKEFTFSEPTEIKWIREKTYFIGTRLRCYKERGKAGLKELIFSSAHEMDVTYIKRPHEEFIKFYMNKV